MNKKTYLTFFIVILFSLMFFGGEVKPLILVSNDDGISSQGLQALAAEMTKLGRVVIVAPKNNMSGSSHSQNSSTATFYGKSDVLPGIEAYWVENTPVNCISWAINHLFGGQVPDLVLSGINKGVNPGESVHYSGTVGAAREGALSGAVALAVSYMTQEHDNDYEGVARITLELAKKALSMGKTHMLWNVNFPKGKIHKDREIIVAKLSRLRWKTRYDARKNLSGKTYFWFSAKLDYNGEETDTDLAALMNGAVTVAPVLLDTTDYKALENVKLLFSGNEKK